MSAINQRNGPTTSSTALAMIDQVVKEKNKDFTRWRTMGDGHDSPTAFFHELNRETESKR